jgi:membrane protein
VILVSIAGYILGNNAIEEQIAANIQDFVGPDAATAVQTLIVGANGQMASAAVFGVVVLLFAASGVLSQLEDSLNLIWRAKPSTRSGIVQYIRSKIFSFTLVFAL